MVQRMLEVSSFYNSKKMPSRGTVKSGKSSIDAPKLTSTPAPNGRGKATFKQNTQKSNQLNKEMRDQT